MKPPHSPKTWLSPFVTVAFAVISITGALLFFHVKNGSVLALHEWFGWLFIAAGLVHLVMNFRPLAAYLRWPAARVSLVVAGVLVALLWIGGARHEGEHGRRGHAPAQVSSVSATP